MVRTSGFHPENAGSIPAGHANLQNMKLAIIGPPDFDDYDKLEARLLFFEKINGNISAVSNVTSRTINKLEEAIRKFAFDHNKVLLGLVEHKEAVQKVVGEADRLFIIWEEESKAVKEAIAVATDQKKPVFALVISE